MKYAEIAKEMEISIKTVEAQVGKALKLLREKLSEIMVLFILFLIQ
jgi:RNA polymerase sigma-70 factor (ECF subfamily)